MGDRFPRGATFADLRGRQAEDDQRRRDQAEENGCPDGATPSTCRHCERRALARRVRWRTVACLVCGRTVWTGLDARIHAHGQDTVERFPLCNGSGCVGYWPSDQSERPD